MLRVYHAIVTLMIVDGLFQTNNFRTCPLNCIVFYWEPHRWCNGSHVLPKCGRSWVPVPIGSNQNCKICICCISAISTQLYRVRSDWLSLNQHNTIMTSCLLTDRCSVNKIAVCKSNKACWSTTTRISWQRTCLQYFLVHI